MNRLKEECEELYSLLHNQLNDIIKHDIMPHVARWSQFFFENTRMDYLTCKNKLTHAYGHALNFIDKKTIEHK